MDAATDADLACKPCRARKAYVAGHLHTALFGELEPLEQEIELGMRGMRIESQSRSAANKKCSPDTQPRGAALGVATAGK